MTTRPHHDKCARYWRGWVTVSRKRARNLSFTPFEAMWWDFEAVLVLVIPNIRPGLKPLELEISSHLRIPSFRSERDDRYCKYEHQIEPESRVLAPIGCFTVGQLGPNLDPRFDPNLFPNLHEVGGKVGLPNSTVRSWHVIWRTKLGHTELGPSRGYDVDLGPNLRKEAQLRASNFVKLGSKLGSKLEHKLCYRETPLCEWLSGSCRIPDCFLQYTPYPSFITARRPPSVK